MRWISRPLGRAADQLKEFLPTVTQASELDTLRGIEGNAASSYFSPVLDEMILNRKEAFYFRGRNRRPPQDNINAMLSFSPTHCWETTAHPR